MGKKVYEGRYTAATGEDSFVVFIIGARVNKFLSFSKWIPVLKAMGPMIGELYQNKELGFLHTEFLFQWRGVTLIQYWRSFDDLEAYAHGKTHMRAWKQFYKLVGKSNAVGIYHETYQVGTGNVESIYGNMPEYGLAKAFEHQPVSKKTETAKKRIAGDENY